MAHAQYGLASPLTVMFLFLLGRLAEAMKKRQSLSDSIMHLIEDAELVNILRNKRKQAQQADR